MSIPNTASPGRRRRLVMYWILAALLASVLAWISLHRGFRHHDAEIQHLTIALPQTPHAGLLHIAAAQGFFDAHDLVVTLLPQTHGKAAVAELMKGNADLAAAADVPVAIELLNGAQLAIAASVANASDEMAVLARRDLEITTPARLQGRRVGVTQGTSADYFLWAFMIRHRVPPQSVTLVDLPPGQLIEALRAGRVDAIAVWQPVRQEAEEALGNAVISFAAPAAYAQSFELVAQKAFLSSHGDTMRRLIQALLDAEHFVMEQPGRAKALLASRLGITPEAIDPAWRALSLEVDQQQMELITLEDVALWAMARGYAPQQPIPDFLPHLYPDALLAVSPGRVTVVR